MAIALLLLRIFSILPGLVVTIEQAIGAGNGADKLAAVVAGVTPMIPDELAPKVIPLVKLYVGKLVEGYKQAHPAFQGSVAAPTATPGLTAEPSMPQSFGG